MANFGKVSVKNLSQVHPDLRKVFNEVIKYYDCAIICGHRDEKDQNKAYSEGRSKLKYPKSKHNKTPSLAVDVVPWFKKKPHIRWNDKAKFYEFAGFVQGISAMLGIPIRWGGNWNMNDELTDQLFFDLPHFELV